MQLRYLLWNPTGAAVAVDSGKIPPDGYSSKIYLTDEIVRRVREFVELGLRPCLIAPCRQRYMQKQLGHGAEPSRLPQGPSPTLLDSTLDVADPGRTAVLGRSDIGQYVQAERTSKALDDHAVENRPKPGPGGPFEILGGRLFIVDAEQWRPEFIRGVTVLIDLTEGLVLQKSKKDFFHARWCAGENVEAQVLEAVVRFCASSMVGAKEHVLVAASQGAGMVIAACVLRERLGVDAKTALSIIMASCPWGRLEKEMIATIQSYRVS